MNTLHLKKKQALEAVLGEAYTASALARRAGGGRVVRVEGIEPSTPTMSM